MDNLPAYKVIELREAIEAVGATVIYLSPTHQIFRQLKTVSQRSKSFSAHSWGHEFMHSYSNFQMNRPQ
jgi:hypothetical protein